MPTSSDGNVDLTLGVTMAKWRVYRKARSAEALYYAITNFVANRPVNPWSGRFRCPSPECLALKRATGCYDLSKGITYCHCCKKHRDSLAIIMSVNHCTIDDAYDTLEAAGVIPVDTLPSGG